VTTSWLLDTSVLSVLAPGRKAIPERFSTWAMVHEPRFYISIISIAEVAAGTAQLRREEKFARADLYDAWIDGIVSDMEDRVLAFDLNVAAQTGRLIDLSRSLGRPPSFADMAIAATAVAHRLTVLTTNLKDFEDLEVAIADPFETLPR
jgi:predicted nucleic acid-binding protein